MRCSPSVLLVSALVVACTAGAGKGNPGSSGDGDNSTIGDGDLSVGDGDLSELPQFDGTIESSDPDTVTATGQQFSVTFTLKDRSGNPVVADWTTDDTRIGSVSGEGVFTGSGFVGGVVKITALVDGSILTTELTVNVDITENPGGLSETEQTALSSGGAADANLEWLYPYTGTVFPRGVTSPSMQLAGEPAISTYVEITAPHYSYRKFGAAAAPIRESLSAEVWNGLALTVRPGDGASVKFSKSSAAGVSGPAEATWHFASASLKGIVYYSTYNYPTPQGELAHDAAIMRVRPGQEAEVVQLGCTACHTVSANGSVLATGLDYVAGEPNPGSESYNPLNSASYDLTEAGTLDLRTQTQEGRTYSFMALTPDGSMGLTNGIPAGMWVPHTSHGIHSEAGTPSVMVDTLTGEEIPSPSLSALIQFAQTPSFSPDGTKVAFVNGDALTADSNQRVLSVMDADLSQSPPVFSNLVDVVHNTDNTAVAWPSFLPDANGVVYHEGDSYDSSGFNPDANAQSVPHYAELKLKDIAGDVISDLNALNGRNADGSFYLPYGEAEEGQMNYEASVLPVAVGGYYWVMFTSRRAYGNTIAPEGDIEGQFDPWGTAALPSSRKKIWIAAIDVNYQGNSDPSHPAFYLSGQTLESGNMRGFAALAPCRAEGETCESGSDCCGGFCRETSRSSDGTPILECVPPPDTCSNADELCETAADCCNKDNQCINNRCTEPTPVVVR